MKASLLFVEESREGDPEVRYVLSWTCEQLPLVGDEIVVVGTNYRVEAREWFLIDGNVHVFIHLSFLRTHYGIGGEGQRAVDLQTEGWRRHESEPE